MQRVSWEEQKQTVLANHRSAAKAAMALMKNGGSAVDAIEVAIKVLEDREITNAGYGSNLAVDGVVECDAVMVDHFGRSGGAGAVARKHEDMLNVSYEKTDGHVQRSETP